MRCQPNCPYPYMIIPNIYIYPNIWFDPFISTHIMNWLIRLDHCKCGKSNNKPSPGSPYMGAINHPQMVSLWHWVYHISAAGLWQLCHAPSHRVGGLVKYTAVVLGVPMPTSWRIVPIYQLDHIRSSHSWSNFLCYFFVVTSMSIYISRRFRNPATHKPLVTSPSQGQLFGLE